MSLSRRAVLALAPAAAAAGLAGCSLLGGGDLFAGRTDLTAFARALLAGQTTPLLRLEVAATQMSALFGDGELRVRESSGRTRESRITVDPVLRGDPWRLADWDLARVPALAEAYATAHGQPRNQLTATVTSTTLSPPGGQATIGPRGPGPEQVLRPGWRPVAPVDPATAAGIDAMLDDCAVGRVRSIEVELRRAQAGLTVLTAEGMWTRRADATELNRLRTATSGEEFLAAEVPWRRVADLAAERGWQSYRVHVPPRGTGPAINPDHRAESYGFDGQPR